MHIFQAHVGTALFLDIVLGLAKRFRRLAQNSRLAAPRATQDAPRSLQVRPKELCSAGKARPFAVHHGEDWRMRDLIQKMQPQEQLKCGVVIVAAGRGERADNLPKARSSIEPSVAGPLSPIRLTLSRHGRPSAQSSSSFTRMTRRCSMPHANGRWQVPSLSSTVARPDRCPCSPASKPSQRSALTM